MCVGKLLFSGGSHEILVDLGVKSMVYILGFLWDISIIVFDPVGNTIGNDLSGRFVQVITIGIQKRGVFKR